MIKKRERKDERKSSDGKDFVVKKPSGLIAKLAKKKKDLPAVQTEIPEMTDQEKSEIRKKCRAKVFLLRNICNIFFYNFYIVCRGGAGHRKSHQYVS